MLKMIIRTIQEDRADGLISKIEFWKMVDRIEDMYFYNRDQFIKFFEEYYMGVKAN